MKKNFWKKEKSISTDAERDHLAKDDYYIQIQEIAERLGCTDKKYGESDIYNSTKNIKDLELGSLVCKIEDSPYRVLKLAGSGKLEELEQLYLRDPFCWTTADSKGWKAIHYAASKNRIQVMDFILQNGGDINICDNKGNTPLHIAVKKEAIDSISYLITNKADTNILNDRVQAPIHLAVMMQKRSSLKELLNHKDKINIHQGGEHGRSALHISAINDDLESTTLLLDSGARLCQSCINNFYPLHEAAKNGSIHVLEFILENGHKYKYDTETLLGYLDGENNTILHAAVNGGIFKAVEICLRFNASIDAQQSDLSTPVHLACAQGGLEILNLMFTMQSEKKEKCLSALDIQHMTPLHRATMFDHLNIVEYLLSKGANINVQDKTLKSPLLLAASRGNWRCMEYLMLNKANTQIKDDTHRNILHYIVIKSGCMQNIIMKKVLTSDEHKLLNARDIFGCTPLHYASQEGHLKSLDNLLKLGAMINLKNNENQSAMHFAARYGRYNTVKKLLDSCYGVQIINEMDGEGMTPLHVACLNGQTKVVQLLLHKGAVVHRLIQCRDRLGRTAFHLAAMNGYTNTLKLLFSIHSHLLDQVDKEGNTALHLAASGNHVSATVYLLSMGAKLVRNFREKSIWNFILENNHQEVGKALIDHERWHELLHLISVNVSSPMLSLIEHMPEVFQIVLDRCHTTNDCDPASVNYYHKFDFSYLQICPEVIYHLRKGGKEVLPLTSLNDMVKFGRVELLSHSVCQQYLKMKWEAYGRYFHGINMIIYCLFLSLLTLYGVRCVELYLKCKIPLLYSEHHLNITLETCNSTRENLEKIEFIKLNNLDWISLTGMMIFVILNILKEFFQIWQQGCKYFKDPINYVEWILYISSGIFVFPTYITNYMTHEQWEFGVVAVFLAWFNLLLYTQRFDVFGIYVVMFLEILRTLIQVSLVFCIPIIGFSIAFYMMLFSEQSFAHFSPGFSLLRTMFMVLGDIDIVNNFIRPYFDEESSTLHFSSLTYFFIVVFALLMPILLVNLMIGLAVGDIEAVQKNAQLKRLAMQVELHTEIEKKLPQWLIAKVDKKELIIYVNLPKSFIERICTRLISSATTALDFKVNQNGKKNYHPGQKVYDECNPFYNKLYKQNKRIKEISSLLEKQYNLMRLIVQKMEIQSEFDDFDEGSLTPATTSKWKKMKLIKDVATKFSLKK